MKVNIGGYRSRMVCSLYENYMDKKYGARNWGDPTTTFERLVERVDDIIQWLYDNSINLYRDTWDEQKINVEIHKYDTWSMDHTLAHIILPMLKQLKETRQGAPWIDFEDVIEELRLADHNERWDWVLGEMIWAFEQKVRDDWESDYYVYEGTKLVRTDIEGRTDHQGRMSNGFRLFGRYYESLWD